MAKSQKQDRGKRMRGISTIGGALGALFLQASGAFAADLYPVFDQYCVATHGDRTAALAAADAAGWITINPAQVPVPPQPHFKLEDYAVRMKMAGQSFQVLLVGSGHAGAGAGAQVVDLPAQFCMAMSKPSDAAAMAKAKTWAGVEPIASVAASNMEMYAFEETGSLHKALIAASDEGKAALAAGRVSLVLTAAPPNDLTMLGYVRLRP